jgi:hypothetical protein
MYLQYRAVQKEREGIHEGPSKPRRLFGSADDAAE